MKIGLIFGTRPEIVKFSPIIRACQNEHLAYFIIHSNQHYSAMMDDVFFRELHLPLPKYNLHAGSGTHGAQTARIMAGVESVLQEERPDVVLVQGDTNTTLAGAIVASKLGILLGHVEAGLRSYDRSMPEEINRIIVDHVSDFLFCPTQRQGEILCGEGIPNSKIFIVGNTIVDAVQKGISIASTESGVLESLHVLPNSYIAVTIHRPATVDSRESLQQLFSTLDTLAKRYQIPVVFPMHPRTRKMQEQFGLQINKQTIRCIEPLGFIDMLQLENNAFFIFTDSGGIQEEACILQKKCVVYRENTERPEVVEVGGSILVGGLSTKEILDKTGLLLNKNITWYNPLGNGQSGNRIVAILSSRSGEDAARLS